MVSDEILTRLKALAERGIGGERENAARILSRLCEERGISPDDLGSDKIDFHQFNHKRGRPFGQLLYQCIYKTIGPGMKDRT